MVGDPDGRVVYMNPCFEEGFAAKSEDSIGLSLANLFDGGAREAVLRAVARVCGGEGSAHFRIREGESAYAALASPIVAEADRVGVIILLTDEPAGEDRIMAFQRDLQEPLKELSSAVRTIAGQVDLLPSKVRGCVDDARLALEKVRRADDVLQRRMGSR